MDAVDVEHLARLSRGVLLVQLSKHGWPITPEQCDRIWKERTMDQEPTSRPGPFEAAELAQSAAATEALRAKADMWKALTDLLNGLTALTRATLIVVREQHDENLKERTRQGRR